MPVLFDRTCILCGRVLPAEKHSAVLCPDCAREVRTEYRYHGELSVPGADGAAAALCCLLAVAGCLLWTPTHYDTLYGLQGRYFLPVLPLLLLTCLPRRLAAVPDEDTAQTRLVAALALVQAGMVVNIMLAIIAR